MNQTQTPNKIAIIGAGSAIFSLALIRDLSLCANLKGSTVHLMDINPERLDSIALLCERFAQETGSDLTVLKTNDRREALQGADFVILVALDFGHDRLRDGWNVAKSHGYRFGGSLHVVHDEAFWVNFSQLRLMESVLLDIREVCPQAWYILVANPVMAGVTYLKRKYPDSRLVGMCHGFGGVHYLAHELGLPREGLTFECVGVNHFVWLTKLYSQGSDALPLLREWADTKAAAYGEKCSPSDGQGPKAVDLYRRFGVYPIGDTCTPGGGSWGWWYHSSPEVQAKWNENPDLWYENYFRWALTGIEKIRAVARDRTQKVSEVLGKTTSDEPMIPLIEALACDVERVVIVNVLNDGGYVPGVPTDFEVEIPALVSKKGIQGLHTDGLPQDVMTHLLRDRVANVELELLAFATGNRDKLVELVLNDPWTTSLEQAEALVTDILNLPCNAEMKAYFAGDSAAGARL